MAKRHKHPSLPSRVYKYGCKPPMGASADLIDHQMRLAHRYKRLLVLLERARRRRVESLIRTVAPQLATLDQQIAQAVATQEGIVRQVGALRQGARKRIKVPAPLKAQLDAAKANLKSLYATRKTTRKTTFASPAWKAAKGSIEEWARDWGKRLRAAITTARKGQPGLYWGTYLAVEAAMQGCRSGAPPDLPRWSGDGHIAVQTQKGLNPANLDSDRRVRMMLVQTAQQFNKKGVALPMRKNQDQPLVDVSLRVGSDKRKPVWATVRAVLHRPLPGDARIQWVHLLRRKVATHYEWHVSVMLAKPDWSRADRAQAGHVGIDVGWRMTAAGLRVACWIGDDGSTGEVVLANEWLAGMQQVRDLQSTRSQNFDQARDQLNTWLKTNTVPLWLAERTATLAHWRSTARLARLVLHWRKYRFAGDQTIFHLLEHQPNYATGDKGGWRNHDKHLYEYERNLAERLFAQRENLYRLEARKLARTYQTAHVEKLDLRDFHKNPMADEEAKNPALKEHVRDACLSLFFRCLKEATSVVGHPAANTTKTCHACGNLESVNGAYLFHTCKACGMVWDQDENAAKNLLQTGQAQLASVPVVP